MPAVEMCVYAGVFGSGLGGEDRRFGIKRKKMMDGCIGGAIGDLSLGSGS